MTRTPLLQINGLNVAFPAKGGRVVANRDVSLSVAPGETLGVVGESGSGKSVLCRAVLRLLPSPPAEISADEITFDGRDLHALSSREMRALRSRDIAMIFQNPMSSLNPVWPIGDQVSEGLRVHHGVGRARAREAAIAALRRVGIPSPEIRIDEYAHQWSGGMAQRAVIAMAMIREPKLLLADEPTTALDVTIQDQILSLLLELQRETGMAIVLVSHDINVISETCDAILVMYAGSVVESGPAAEVLRTPSHPYTCGLLSSVPELDRRAEKLVPIPGQPPDLSTLGSGCPFAARCPVVSDECATLPIALKSVGPNHQTACHFPERVAAISPRTDS